MPFNLELSRQLSPLMQRLEDRIMFDAAPDAVLLLPESPAEVNATLTPVQVEQAEISRWKGPRELVIIDASVDDSIVLIEQLAKSSSTSSIEIRLLDANRDGVEQISAILDEVENGEDFSALHIVSHGTDGAIKLGNSWLNHENLPSHAGQLGLWGDSLTSEADILFYGCNLGGSVEGIEFIETIAMLTGADVAASDDPTGHESLGGDWVLETAVGKIETQAVVATQWNGLLAPPVANDDTYTIVPDVANNIDPVGDNDTDADGDSLTITEIIDPATGTPTPITVGTPITLTSGTVVELLADGTINVTQPLGADGIETFDYTLSDGSVTDTATISLQADTDADGVANIDDIDDDNDGILDSLESPLDLGAVENVVPNQPPGSEIYLLSDRPNAGTSMGTLTLPDGSTVDYQHTGSSRPNSSFGSLHDPLYWIDSGTLTLDFSQSQNDVGFIFWGVDSADSVGVSADGIPVDLNLNATIENYLNDGSTNSNEPVVNAAGSLIVAGGTGYPGYTSVTIGGGPFSQLTIATNGTGAGMGFVGLGVGSSNLFVDVDSDLDGVADRLDIDKDNDGITDNVEAQTTSAYVAPSGTGPGITDVNNDGLDDVYDTRNGVLTAVSAAATVLETVITEIDTDSDGTVDTLDSDSDNDGVDDVAERGDGQSNSTPLGPYNDADHDGLLDEFEAGTTTDGYNVNDENIAGDDGGTDGDYSNFTLADIDVDTNANEAVANRTSNDAVALTNDLAFRDAIDDRLPPELDLDTTDVGASSITSTDDFSSVDFTGGSGWLGPWTEIGEVDGSSAGDISVVVTSAQVLRLLDFFSPGVQGIQRSVDINGANAATLTLDFQNINVALGEFISVQISSDGINFTEIDQLDSTEPAIFTNHSYDISSYASANTTVRFLTSLSAGGLSWGRIDNVTVSTAEAAPTGYAASYLPNESPVSIASTATGISDGDSVDMSGATITLNNPQTGDALAVSGSVVAANATGTITGTSIDYTVSADGYTITLTNLNSIADYETAIETIGFFSSSTSTFDRTINVQVVDHLGALSNIATSTIHVDLDSDGDGVADAVDIDDDNDGITDLEEIANAQNVTRTNIFSEDFGAGGRTSTPYTTYTYEDGLPGTGPTIDVGDGEYAVAATTGELTTLPSWEDFSDHTGDANGRMLVVNASFAPDEFYRRSITVTENSFYEFSAFARNVIRPGTGILQPDVTFEIQDINGGLIASATTGSIAEDSQWHNVGITFSSGFNSTIQLVMLNNGAGGGGNDLAIDDVHLDLLEADTDFDNILDTVDIDSDNDGITDNVEAQTTAGYIAPSGRNSTVIDTNNDGLDDNYDTGIIAGDDPLTGHSGIGLTPVDTDSDTIADYVDTDSDNDEMLDVAERGDGQPTGLTSTLDTDGDGLVDIFEGANVNDGLDVNDENIVGDDGGTDGDYSSFALADSDSDTNANEIVSNRTTNDAVAITSDLNFRDALDTDGDSIADHIDIDDDNDGILDVNEGFIAPSGTGPKNIVLLIDQSSSIFGSEIIEIKNGLTSFINGQIGSGNTVSFVGMSHQNTDQNAGQHVLNVTFPTDGTDVTVAFDTWITNYRDGSVSVSSDNWSSALEVAAGMPLGAGDEVIIITDGAGGSSSMARGHATTIEQMGAHLFAIGMDNHTYFAGANRNIDDAVSLVFDNDPSGTGGAIEEVTDYRTDYDSAEFDRVSSFANLRGALSQLGGVLARQLDTDGDGIADHLDIDKDNDGITDNVEAQSTAGYIAPSGIGTGITDVDGDGLDDNYDADTNIGTTTEATSAGLSEVDTDGDDTVDTLDSDSDGDGVDDIAERGDSGPTSVTSTTDSDLDGLLDIFEDGDGSGAPGDLTDGFDVNDENRTATTLGLAGGTTLASDGSNAVPLARDLLFRDVNDAPLLDLDGDDSNPVPGTFNTSAELTDDGMTATGTLGDGTLVSSSYTITANSQTGFGSTNFFQVGTDRVRIGLTASGTTPDTYDLSFSAVPDEHVLIDSITFNQPINTQDWGPGDLTVMWLGVGTATISDPDNQISNHSDGDVITSGTLLQFSTLVQAADASWSVTVDADNVNLAYAAVGEADQEVVDFRVNMSSTSHLSIFTEGGNAVSIADIDTSITDVDDTHIESATVVFTNPQADDILTLDGTTLFSGGAVHNNGSITVNGNAYTVNSVIGGGGEVTITLTGSYTKAQFANAIEAITFNNTSQDPVTIDRVIEVTVNDGEVNSNTANSLIQVAAVNDAPVANPDPLTAYEGYSATIAPLANDSDVDGDSISIAEINGNAIAVGGSAAVTNGTVTLNADNTLTFAPAAGYSGPVSFAYTVDDGNGGATVGMVSGSVIPEEAVPELTLRNDPLSIDVVPFGWSHNIGNDGAFEENSGGQISQSGTPEVAGAGLTINYSGTKAELSDVDAKTLSEAVTNEEYLDYSVTMANFDPQLHWEFTGVHFHESVAPGYDRTVLVSTDPNFADAQVLLYDSTYDASAGHVNHSATQSVTVLPGETYYFRVYVYNVQSGTGPVHYDDFSPTMTSYNVNDDVSYVEGASRVNVDLAAISGDVNDYSENDIATLKIVVDPSKVSDGSAEIVNIVGTDFPLDADAGPVSLSFGGEDLDVTYDSTTGTFTVVEMTGGDGVMDQSMLDSLIRGVTYENTSADPTAGDRTLAFSVTDTAGNTSNTATSTITVSAINDTPIAEDNTATVTEDGPLSDSGNVITDDDGQDHDSNSIFIDQDIDGDTLIVTDVDGTAVSGATNIVGIYGTLTINPDGSYTYNLDNSNPTVQALGDTDTLTESFTYTITDQVENSVNGDFSTNTANPDRSIFNGVLPDGWTAANQTPDTFNATTTNGGSVWSAPPGGGDFVHAAVATALGLVEGLEQTLTGLTPGHQYVISFDQSIWNGIGSSPADGRWAVNIAGQSFTSDPMALPAPGVAAGWQGQTITFTATATTETLQFIGDTVTPGVLGVGVANISVVAIDTADLIVTINGADDPITIGGTEDGSAVVGADAEVWESHLATGSNPTGNGETATGTFTLSAPDGIDTLDVGGTSVPLADLNNLGTTPVTITGAEGDLTLTGFNSTTGAVTYSYTLTGEADHSGGQVIDDFAMTLTDDDGETQSGAIGVLIVDDTPTAVNDSNIILEDGGPISDGVGSNDVVGADFNGAQISGVAAGTGTPVAANLSVNINGAYGQLQMDNFGFYQYIVDNSNPAVQALSVGQSITDVFTYELTDSDGDTSTATLSIDIFGRNDVPIAEDNTAAVTEDGPLSDSGNVIGDDDGQDHDSNSIFVDQDIDDDTLIVTDVDGTSVTGTTNVIGAYGTLTINSDGSYTYNLDNTNTDVQALGDTDSLTETFTYRINDQAQLIHNGDFSDFDPSTDTTNFNGELPRGWEAVNGTPDIFDENVSVFGLTYAPSPSGGTFLHALANQQAFSRESFSQTLIGLVPGEQYTVNFSQTASSNTFDTGQQGQWIVSTGGTTFNSAVMTAPAMGTALAWTNQSFTFTATSETETLSFTAALFAPGVNGFQRVDLALDGVTISELGAEDTAELIITINGADDPITFGSTDDGNAVSGADAEVLESDLASGSNAAGTRETATGTFNINAADGIASLEIAGTTITLAQLNNSTTTNIVVVGAEGDLTINGFNAATGEVSYSYTLTSSVDHSGGPVIDDFALTLTDEDGDTQASSIGILVLDDAPTAADDADSVTEDSGGPATGNVVTGLDVLSGNDTNTTDGNADSTGADGLAATPIVGLIAGIGSPLAGNVGSAILGTYGTLTLNGDGTYSYAVDNNNATVDSLQVGDPVLNDVFTYEITDTDGDTSTATLTISISGTNDPPIANPENVVINEDTNATGNVLTNDTDVDSTALILQSATVDVDGDGTPDNLTLGSPTAITNNLGNPIGTLTLNTNGTYTFVPAPNYNGSVPQITYTVEDPMGNRDTSTLDITVNPINDPPVANLDTRTVNEDNPASGNLLTNDSDFDGDLLTVTMVTVDIDGDGTPDVLPLGTPTTIIDTNGDPIGELTVNPNGVYTFTPEPNYNGSVPTITYTVEDPSGNSDSSSLSIVITPVNDHPVAEDDEVQGTGHDDITGNVLDNDSDPEGDPLTVNTVPVTPPNHGTVNINPDGTFTYTPAPEFTGTDTFEYEVCDDSGECSTATVTVTVFNAPPVAIDDNYELNGLSPVMGSVFDNDSDPNNDPLTGTTIVPPEHGTLDWNTDGTFTYTPGPTFSGSDTFQYQVCDDEGACSEAFVNIRAPFAYDSFTNESLRDPFDGVDIYDHREILLSHELHNLASEPVLAGYATPGSLLVGKIYDSSGALIGETTTIVSSSGNWVMNFFGTKSAPGGYAVIEHIATEEVELGNPHHFRLTADTYRSFQLGQSHVKQATIGSIMTDSPGMSLDLMHNQNTNPLSLLD